MAGERTDAVERRGFRDGGLQRKPLVDDQWIAGIAAIEIIERGLPLLSAKTRRNIKIAARAWTIDPAPDRAAILGAALPLSAAYLAGPFPAWARGVLLGAAAVGGAILLWWRGRLTGLRYGLALLAVAALAGWIWR